jgi:hypothetical protein
MKTSSWTALCAAALAVTGVTGTAVAETCDRQLAVQLTPDVPDPRDAGFLSSLLGNQVEYRLTFLGQADDSDIRLELSGPGPAYRCREVIHSMRKDGRVVTIRVRANRS